jgi:hypothetical protein
VDALLAAGADANAGTGYGRTALHRAAYRGHSAVVAALLTSAQTVEVDGPGPPGAVRRPSRFPP